MKAWILASVCTVMLALLHARAGGQGKEAAAPTLPKPRLAGDLPLEKALLQRRSVRTYAERALTLAEVSQLLWAAQGVTAPWGGRTAPSAGALYPLEVYLAVGEVDGLRPGLYHYSPNEHALRTVKEKDVRRPLSKAAVGQRWVADAPAVIVIAAVAKRTASKYGARAERYVNMEVGCVCQNVHLQCESLGLGTVAVGAFEDRDVRRILGEEPAPLLLMPVGAKRKGGE